MLYVNYNIHTEENKSKVVDFTSLPESCWESAELLNDNILLFEKNNIFPRGTLMEVIKKLKSYHDIDLSERLYGKNNEIKTLVDRYLHTR
jgi:glutamine synthetase